MDVAIASKIGLSFLGVAGAGGGGYYAYSNWNNLFSEDKLYFVVTISEKVESSDSNYPKETFFKDNKKNYQCQVTNTLSNGTNKKWDNSCKLFKISEKNNEGLIDIAKSVKEENLVKEADFAANKQYILEMDKDVGKSIKEAESSATNLIEVQFDTSEKELKKKYGTLKVEYKASSSEPWGQTKLFLVQANEDAQNIVDNSFPQSFQCKLEGGASGECSIYQWNTETTPIKNYKELSNQVASKILKISKKDDLKKGKHLIVNWTSNKQKIKDVKDKSIILLENNSKEVAKLKYIDSFVDQDTFPTDKLGLLLS